MQIEHYIIIVSLIFLKYENILVNVRKHIVKLTISIYIYNKVNIICRHDVQIYAKLTHTES
jgi:hypothetical protein